MRPRPARPARPFEPHRWGAGDEARPYLRRQLIVGDRPGARPATQPGMEPGSRDAQRSAQPCHRPDRTELRDKAEIRSAALRVASAPSRSRQRPFRMSRSALSFITSRRRRSISSCSGFCCPWPGNACFGSEPNSFTHLRRTFSCTPMSRDACATLTPRSRTRRTASTLNSRLNMRLAIPHLQLHETPFLGVHETGGRPPRHVAPLSEV